MVGWLTGGSEGDPEAFSYFAGWSLKATLCDVHGCHN